MFNIGAMVQQELGHLQMSMGQDKSYNPNVILVLDSGTNPQQEVSYLHEHGG